MTACLSVALRTNEPSSQVESTNQPLTRGREALLELLRKSPRWDNPIHGAEHWRRVVANGLLIADHTPGVDRQVVELFGMLHDSQRENDDVDDEHGSRAAFFARCFQDLLGLDKAQLSKLLHALANHTDEGFNTDPTIGACYDADRLDLGRVGIRPDPERMNTEHGRKLAIGLHGHSG